MEAASQHRGRIPEAFIENLRERVDTVEIINARVTLKKMGANYGACCPFHQEKTPSFVVFPQGQNYHCFGCGAHGDVISFLMDFEHLSYVESIYLLAAHAGVEVPRNEGDGLVAASHEPMYQALEGASNFYQWQLRHHPDVTRVYEYLKDRGITPEVSKKFGLGYAPPGWDNFLSFHQQSNEKIEPLVESGLLIQKEPDKKYDRFRDRLMFPIRNRRGRVIGFGARTLGDEQPKYLNSPETPVFQKGRELYGFFEARQSSRRLENIIVVEGYMDVVALSQFGITNAVGTLGTAVTEAQLRLLFRHTKVLYFCFDGDKAGRTAATRVMSRLFPVIEDGQEAWFMFLPEGDDPDSLVRRDGVEGFKQRMDEAMSFTDFFFETIGQGVDAGHIDSLAGLVKAAAPYLQGMSPGILRDMILKNLAAKVDLDVHVVREHVLKRDKSLTPPVFDEQPIVPTYQRPKPKAYDTPVITHQAMGLLLRAPELLSQLAEDATWLPETQLRDVESLLCLVDILRSQPELAPAELLSAAQGRVDKELLIRASASVAVIPEAGLVKEFEGALLQIQASWADQQYQKLIEKSRKNGITAEEKARLMSLLVHKQTV